MAVVARQEQEGATLAFGPFRLDPKRPALLEHDRAVPLGGRAIELLVALAQRAGEVVGKDDLIARVWRGSQMDDSNLRVHVAAVRRALRDGQDGQRYIVNIPGRGYSFVAPVNTIDDARAQPARDEGRLPRAPLPPLATWVHGRDAMIEQLCAQLLQRRFVTLVGPGGIGKTTVALAVAHRMASACADGACFVDFSSIREPPLVSATIAAALGLSVLSQDVTPAVALHLARMELLLVLDNCEHVVGTAAGVAERIVAEAPGVRLLCTSREPLRASGERVHRLPPLASPGPAAGITADQALTFSCVQLFTERVAANVNGFQLDDGDAPLVSEICRRLDGNALAVELAASRVPAFGMRELADRLDDRFRLLTGGRRTALPRHRTLAATLDWSYDLLPPQEQRVLNRLSVFAGDFSLEGAVAVAVMPGDPTGPVVSHLADLVAKSLIVATTTAHGVRYRLLETTRLYAAEKLGRGDEAAAVARAHAAHLLDRFGSAERDAETMTAQDWRATYATQIDNLRAALGWASGPEGDPALFVRLVVAAIPLWVELSLMGECRTWAERGLAAIVDDDDHALDARMRLMAALGWSLMFATARTTEVGATWTATLALAERLANQDYRLRALWGVWIGKLNHGELDGALDLANRMQALVQGSTNESDIMTAERLMATTLHYRGEQREARVFIDRLFARYAAAPPQPRIARFHVDQQVTGRYFQARILWLQGDVDQALQAVARNIAEGESLANALSVASILGQAAGPIALLTGDLNAAERYGITLQEHAERHGLRLWQDWARCFCGLTTIRRGRAQEGLEVMRAVFERAGESRLLPRYMLLLGFYAWEAGSVGQLAFGLDTIGQMIARCERSGERWFQPELMRLRGELTACAKDAAPDAGAADFAAAMALAARQGARSWELRAAMSLARARLAAGAALHIATRDLAAVYGRFTEGFDTADLREARALLARS
jgi:predicted ATPase/DNA-binding winged helix-turn-helix (wHTH) protein